MSYLVQVIPSADTLGIDSSTWASVAAGILLLFFLMTRVFGYVEPIRNILEYLWNIMVTAMPASLLLGQAGLTKIYSASGNDGSRRRASIHAAKSEALRSALRLDRLAMETEEKKWSATPKGLGNWDNSCYQNSVLQSLSSLSSFKGFLRTSLATQLGAKDETTAKTLYDLTEELNDGSSSSRYTWTPALLKSMNSWQQQDAQEYFSKIIDAVEKDSVLALQRSNVQTAFQAFLSPSNPPSSRSKSLPRSPSHPLEGFLAQRVGCTQCGYTEGLSMIPFTCVTLPLSSSQESTLDWSLDRFCELETIEGVHCVKCTLLKHRAALQKSLEFRLEQGSSVVGAESRTAMSEWLEATEDALVNDSFDEKNLMQKCGISDDEKVSTNKTRQGAFLRMPKCLVLHLNRSIFDERTFQQLKNYTEMSYPEELDLSRWCLGISKDNDEESWPMNPSQPMLHSHPKDSGARYSLRAVVNHHGRHENGHYVAIRKVDDFCNPNPTPSSDMNEQSTWWRISDEKVAVSDKDEALSQGGAFMLFYELLENHQGEAHHPQNIAGKQEEERTNSDGTSELSKQDSPVARSDSSWTEVAHEDEEATVDGTPDAHKVEAPC